MYLKEKQYKIAMILLCPVQGPWASSLLNVDFQNLKLYFHPLYIYAMHKREGITVLKRTPVIMPPAWKVRRGI